MRSAGSLRGVGRHFHPAWAVHPGQNLTSWAPEEPAVDSERFAQHLAELEAEEEEDKR
jgi:hypothetical protein